LLALENDPRPFGSVKLVGEEDAYRIRIGDYRAVYLIDDRQQIVAVVRVAHRREVYR
jgi:mRNA interferase RelE/StbE